ncbi:DUF3703 domain-containing protein [Ilumatobacter nonamiensis]|uniref:DUF3703 domain-containing protein n=1 Tax=Ilumatobacter nonamiensis TaxID=467093 RepID=UPI0003499C78|nr:DUF3703 domain-containing protein [Ilumatobacter nonamiensis]
MAKSSTLPDAIRTRIDELLDGSNHAQTIGDPRTAWQQLEDAHILSQPWVRPHLKVHAHMLSLAWRQRDVREIVGQVSRILLAGPGSATGRYPAGNTGRSRVSAFVAMPIRDDLESLLATAPNALTSETGTDTR